ncbi:MAG: hypothetical protein HQK56_05850 [Deltaproteobacteria bacterium]|nr:hypothetical protein [Deltaproteobacteria bacterium]
MCQQCGEALGVTQQADFLHRFIMDQERLAEAADDPQGHLEAIAKAKETLAQMQQRPLPADHH